MQPIYKNLYQFSEHIPSMDFTIHQYLLAADPAVLFAAGTVLQAQSALPIIKDILGGRELKYIFVSHMESDECGGLSVLLEAYPKLQVICSALCARELAGFGYEGAVTVGGADRALSDGQLQLRFFHYPSEVHLQDGLLCLERNSGIFYSSDLMLRFGNGSGAVVNGSWTQEVSGIDLERIPNPEKLAQVKRALSALSPSFIAVGHGFCIRCS